MYGVVVILFLFSMYCSYDLQKDLGGQLFSFNEESMMIMFFLTICLRARQISQND